MKEDHRAVCISLGAKALRTGSTSNVIHSTASCSISGRRYRKISCTEWRKPIAGPQSVPCVVVIDGVKNSENSGLVR